MTVPLRIARWATQLRLPADVALESQHGAWLRQLSQQALPAALGGVAERALVRAGLPPEAVVAVRRLNLRLQVADGDWGVGARDEAFLKAWSQALEQALVQALEGVRRATPGMRGSAAAWSTNLEVAAEAMADPVVVFDDAWAAETAHLRQLLQVGEPAWWADRLRDRRGERLDLTPASILRRWLEQQPARAVATMDRLASLTNTPQTLGELLGDRQALALSDALAQRLSQRPIAEPELPEAGSALRALLESCLASLASHPQLGGSSIAAAGAARLRPWRLAALLQRQPSLSQLSPPTLIALVAGMERGHGAVVVDPAAFRLREPQAPERQNAADVGSEQAQFGPGARAAVPREAATSATTPRTPPTVEQVQGRAWIHAGGMLLLLNHPALLAPSSGEPPQGSPAGDLALLALHRLLTPLGAGERAAALQRERPLLALLAPDRAWPERLDLAEPLEPAAGKRHLALLIGAIPEAIGFAPGAIRQVYGPAHGATPPLPDRASHRLAALLWRPGLLAWDAWELRLSWPLASVDGALRREGWDLDPGWQPALRRVVRFRYGDASEPIEEGLR